MADYAIRLLVYGFVLERELQRHLYLPWAADGMGYIAKAGGAVIEAFVGLVSFGIATGGESGLSRRRELVEVLILKDLIARNVEARGVGEVVHVKRVFEAGSFGQVGHFHQRNICPLLRGLAEDVALAGGEAGLDRISRGHRGRQRAAWGNQRNGKALGVQGGKIIHPKSSGVTGLRFLG